MKQFATVFLLLLFACGRDQSIVVGSKNFSEQVLLGELLAQHIEQTTGYKVQRKLNLGGTFICHQALLSGDIDLYVEYTGTALTAVLKKEPKTDPAAVLREVQQAYKNQFDIVTFPPLGFNNTFAILIRGDVARQLQIKTISEARPYTSSWTPGFGYEFIERKDGFAGLVSTYNLQFAREPKVMDLTLTYTALAGKQVDLIAGNSTDGLIEKLDLFQLHDDKNYFPPYEAVPLVRAAALRDFPKLEDALKQLAGRINEEQMRRMNYLVDVEHKDVKNVAADFLSR